MARFDLSQYVTVQERIVQFWKDHPDGRIVTDLISDPSQFEQVVVRAAVYTHRDHPHPDATDLAAETKGQGGMANATSWHENAATSAIGRALANLGYATTQKDRPSREEMEKVVRMERSSGPERITQDTGEIRSATRPTNDQEPTRASQAQKNLIRGLWKQTGHIVTDPDGTVHHDAMSLDEALSARFQHGVDGLTVAQAKTVIDGLQKQKTQREGATA